MSEPTLLKDLKCLHTEWTEGTSLEDSSLNIRIGKLIEEFEYENKCAHYFDSSPWHNSDISFTDKECSMRSYINGLISKALGKCVLCGDKLIEENNQSN